MQYKLIGNNDYSNPIDEVLTNRGIVDKNSFLKPTVKNTIHHSKLVNIHRAVECLMKHIKEGGELFVQVDSDPQMASHLVLC